MEAKLEGPLPDGKEFVFEPDLASMRACGVIAPESLLTMQSEGRVFVPVENYDGIDARLESDTALGFVVRQGRDLCYCKEVYEDTCEVKRPEAASQALRVQAECEKCSKARVRILVSQYSLSLLAHVMQRYRCLLK